jgi:hypothetical protein
MPIDQQQPAQPAVPAYISQGTHERAEDLEYPHAPTPVKTTGSGMPLILWSLSLLFGILMFLTRLPLSPPPIGQLTKYTCDPLPRLPNLGNRFQSYSLNLRCKAGDQSIYQSTKNIPHLNLAGTTACTEKGSATQIWRMTPPSPYGSYVFQVACGDLMITSYTPRADNYETTQRFVRAFSTLFTAATAIGLAVTFSRLRRRPHPFLDPQSNDAIGKAGPP